MRLEDVGYWADEKQRMCDRELEYVQRECSEYVLYDVEMLCADLD